MRVLFILLLSIYSTILLAQIEEFGTWSSLSAEKSIGEIGLSAEAELRTIYGMQLINRASIGLGIDYRINDYLKVAAGYNFMNTLDTKYYNYQLRHRYNTSVTGRIKVERFTFSLRERVQLTSKDESKRIRENGTIDTYRINPAWVWRNRFQAEYNIRKSKFTPSISAESFYELNNPAGNSFYKMRYTLSCDYRINKRNSVSAFAVLNTGFDDEDLYGKYILGINYNIKL
jgi:hypothetical protein